MKTRLLVTLAMVFLAGFLASAAHAGAVDAQKAYIEGVSLVKKHEYTKALAQFDSAIKSNPSFVKAYVGKGICFLMQDKHEASVEVLNKAIQMDPQNVTALFCRGQASLLLGHSKEAMADFSAVLKRQPENARSYINRAICEFRLGDPKAAVTDASRAIAYNPRSADAFALRGISYWKGQQFEKSLEDLNKAVELNPKDAYYQLLRYLAKAQNGDASTDELAKFSSTLSGKEKFPHYLIGLFIGQVTPEDCLKFAAAYQPARLRPTFTQVAQVFVSYYYTLKKDTAKAQHYRDLAAKGESKTPVVQGLLKKEMFELK